MLAQNWIAAFADKLGTTAPSEQEVETILALAGVAAHASERTAAPVACWLAARAGIELNAAMAAAKEVVGT